MVSSKIMCGAILAMLFNVGHSRKLLDSVCGQDQRFMVALKCADGNSYLHCAPNNLVDRTQFCTNPNVKWSEAKCKAKGGYMEVDVLNTGCYPMTTQFWKDFSGVAVDPEYFCESFPVKTPDVAVPVNLGFESGSLEGWAYSGPNPSTVSVVCDGTAPEGSCYASISTAATNPSTQSNKISRSDLVVSNPGGCNNLAQQLKFWHKFSTTDYLPYNDYLKVVAKDGLGNLITEETVDVAEVGNYGSSDWKQVVVELGSVPVGTKLVVEISAESKNVRDGVRQSTGYVDGFDLVAA